MALGLAAGAWSLARVRGPRPASRPGRPAGAVTVIVPSRDEARALPVLLGSLRSQTLEPARVIVVDDGSSDGTAAVAARLGAEVVAAGPLPAGWTGKAHACWVGARLARTDLLVFLDADTALARDGIERLVAEHARTGGLLSVQPYHTTVRPYEQLSLYFNVVAAMGVGAFGPRERAGVAAFGPCVVCRRADYEAVGGHRAVRGEVVEDVALARRFHAHGYPVRLLAGRGTVRFRMYPGGFRQLVEGWTKNFGAGARLTRVPDLVRSVLWVTATGSGAIELVTRRDLTAVSLYAACAGSVAWSARKLGDFRWWVIASYPLALACFLAVFARSLWHTYVRGSVEWRGRRIPTRGHAV